MLKEEKINIVRENPTLTRKESFTRLSRAGETDQKLIDQILTQEEIWANGLTKSDLRDEKPDWGEG